MNNLIHFGAIRIRLTGSGYMQSSLLSYDEVQQSNQVQSTMQSVTAYPVNILTNFTAFASKLELKTVNFGESFFISQIILYVKPVATSIPQ